MTDRTLVLAGASGLVGGFALDAALARGWRVVALVRAGRTLPERPDLKIIACDFDALDGLGDQIAALTPLAFVSALGTTIRVAGSQEAFARVDRDYVAAFARLGVAAGASRFAVVTAVGSDAKSGNFYLRTKGETELLVRSAGYEHLEIARPSMLVGDRTEKRFFEEVSSFVAPAVSLFMPGPLSIYRPIAAATVGRALIAGVERVEPGIFIRHYRDLVALAQV